MRVGNLALRLHAPHSYRAEATTLKGAVEARLMPGVLARLESRLTARLGRNAQVYVQSLTVKLRLRRAELGSDALIDSIVDDLMQYVLQNARKPQRRNPAAVFGAPVQIFQSRAQRRAVMLIAAAKRQKGPAGHREDMTELWREFEGWRPNEQADCMTECNALDGLPVIVAQVALPLVQAAQRRVKGHVPHAVAATLRHLVARRLLAELPVGIGDSRESASTPSPARNNGHDAPGETSHPNLVGDHPVPREEPHYPDGRTALSDMPPDERRAGPKTETGSRGEMPDAVDTPEGENTPPTAESRTSAVPHDTDISSAKVQNADGGDTPVTLVLQSDWCGLFYLLNVAARIGLQEMLWRIGLSEGDALAAMLRLLAGEGDPAPEILSPNYPRPAAVIPALQDWAQRELEADIAAAMHAIDPGGQVAARADTIEAVLRDTADWQLAARGAAVLLAATERSIGRKLDGDARALAFGLPGRIVIEEDRITVYQSVDAIDIDFRRAGLDADPGWLAWLKRDLVFVFTDVEVAP